MAIFCCSVCAIQRLLLLVAVVIVELQGLQVTSLSSLCHVVAVPVVICLVLVPGKLPENVAERRKNMSNVLKIVWLCLKTKTRLSLRNSRPSKIFIVIKQNNCLSFGPCLLWTLIKAWEEAILQIAMWTWERDTWGPCGTQFCLVFSDWFGRYSETWNSVIVSILCWAL